MNDPSGFTHVEENSSRAETTSTGSPLARAFTDAATTSSAAGAATSTSPVPSTGAGSGSAVAGTPTVATSTAANTTDNHRTHTDHASGTPTNRTNNEADPEPPTADPHQARAPPNARRTGET